MLDGIIPTIVEDKDKLIDKFNEKNSVVKDFLISEVEKSILLSIKEDKKIKESLDEIIYDDKNKKFILFLSDVIVSLTENRVLIKNYCDMREKYYNKILSNLNSEEINDILDKKDIDFTFNDLNYKINFFDYIKLLGNNNSKELYMINNSVKNGKIIINRKKMVNILSQNFSDNLNKKLPLNINIEKFNKKEKIKKQVEKINKKIEKEGLKTPKIEASKLNSDLFPPCIKNIISGVEKGERNFTVSVVLTAFISHARFIPEKDDALLNDCVRNIDYALNEIMPIIEKAANNTSPPLFEDQPTEKENIYATLGLDKEGNINPNGKWYIPPNCESIEMKTSVCNPDKYCKEKDIKNPLSYYIKKKIKNYKEKDKKDN